MRFNFPASLSTIPLFLHLASTSLNPLGPLHWDVYLAPGIPVTFPGENYIWSQTAFTFIHGISTAILVDAPISASSTNLLADWIERTIPGKQLTHIYITHGHGDHFYGVPILQQRFPGLIPIATADVIAHAEAQLQSDALQDFWEVYFPGQIPPQTEIFTPLPTSGAFTLEGHALNAIPVGQTDTYNTTILHIPDLDMVVTGDVVYGEYFQYLAESDTPALRAQWLSALYDVLELKPKIVVPSHKQEWDGYSIEHVQTTREYLEVWGLEVLEASSKEDLMTRMMNAFPERLGGFILELSAEAAFPSS